MDLVDGRPLCDVVADGPMSLAQVISVGMHVGGALAAVHATGLVHRDIKPQNIIVRPDGEARLIDFGLAIIDASGPGPTVGTLAYASAEQSGMLKRPVDHRSDLYSLGVVLFECLTGSPPFRSGDLGELLRLHAIAEPPDPRTLRAGVPDTMADVVARLLAKDPDDRYQSARSLVADLQRLSQNPAARFEPGLDHRDLDRRTRDPLCGRHRELGLLNHRWSEAVTGRGGICLIRGPAGSGKTRLADELAANVRGEGRLVLSSPSAEDDAIPYAALRTAIEDHIRSAARLPPGEREPVMAQLRAAAGTAGALLGSLSPALGDLLGAATVTEGEDANQFGIAVVDFLTELARLTGGLLLRLDDVQWLDAGTRAVLARLSGLVSAVPLLVVATGREEGGGAAGVAAFVSAADAAADLEVTLGPLDEPGVVDLVAARLPGLDIHSRLGRLLAVRGNGNPFVILEYLRAVIDNGLVRPSWGTWQLDEDALDALNLPADALGLVLSRVDGLGVAVRTVLTGAAALVRFRPHVVAEVCDVRPEVAVEAIREAAGRLLVEPRDGDTYAFVHDRIRTALLDDLDESARSRLHLRIARALDRAPAGDSDQVYAVAHHYMQAGPAAPADRSFATCRRAGELALSNHAPAEAVSFLQRAADTGRPLDPEFLYTLGAALQGAGRYAEAEQPLGQALDAETSPVHRARIFLLLAVGGRASWKMEKAHTAIQQGLAELGGALPTMRLRLAGSTVWLFLTGLVVGLTRLGFGSVRGERRARYELLVALNTQAGYVSAFRFRTDLLFLYSIRPLYWLNRLGSGAQYTRGKAVLAYLAAMLHRTRPARRTFARAHAAAAAVGHPRLRAEVEWFRGIAAYMSGQDDGADWARATEEHGRWLDSGQYSDVAASLAWDAAVRGRTDEAAAWLARGRERIGSPDAVTSLVTIDAVVKTASARPAEAAAELDRIRVILATHGSKGLRINLVLAEMHALVEQGELGAAFERAADEFFGLRLKASQLIRQHRPFFVHYAFGRLAQVRAARDEAVRSERLAAARQALAQLRAVANTELLRACEQVALADLEILEGSPGAAVDRLGRLGLLRTDAPLLAYERARVMARALTMLGHAEARRQALYALAVAAEHAWPHRARWVRTEFGVESTSADATSPYLPAVTARGMERQRLQALEAVSRAAMRVLDPDALARIALDETIRILAAERAFLFLTVTGEDGATRLVPYVGRDAFGTDVQGLTGYSTTLVEKVHESGEPLVVTGTEEGAVLGARSVVVHGLRSVMVAPLRLDRRRLGVVYLDSRVATGVFTGDDVGILTALTTHIAIALETARAAQLEVSIEAARRQRDLAEQLREAFAAMSGTLEPDEVLDQLVGHAARILPGRHAWLITRTPAGFVERRADRDGRTLLRQPVPIDVHASEVFTIVEPMVGTAASTPPPLERWLGSAASWTAVPLIARDAPFGVLVLVSDRAEEYGGGQPQVAAVLASQAIAAHDRATLFAQVQALAIVDQLSGIANRRHFFDLAERALAQARRHGHPVAAAMVDLDRFKAVNDTYGHATGDDVIRAVASRLSAAIRDTDVLGRYGGEEFALLLPDADPAGVHEFTDRLRRAVAAEPVATRSGDLRITISVGVTMMQDDERDVSTVLARADTALYAAKQHGRDQVRVA
jgi:diguanylate cyclase (GGDEF)-like protein